VLSVALNLLLLPKYGLMGGAITAVLTYLSCVVYGYFRGKGDFQVTVPWLEMGKILLAAMLMYLLMRQTPSLHHHVYDLLLKMLVGITSYGILVWTLDIGKARQLIKARLGWATVFSTSSHP
jgi:O-antigen/teichoic acid export membrane protein